MDHQECIRHVIIDDDTRQVDYEDDQHKCDSNLAEGWYRFANGKHFNSKCARYHYCDTENPGWLIGAHPQPEEGRVSRRVCFGRSAAPSCSCVYQTDIMVRNCGSFYVYKLKPTPACSLRYCTN